MYKTVENSAGGHVWYSVLDAKGYPVAQGDYALCRGACIQHDAKIKGNVMAMTLKDVIGGFSTVLDKFMRRPEVKKGTSEAILTMSAAQVVNETSLQNLKELIQPQIQDVLDMLILTNGERDTLNDFEKSEWDEAIDDAIGNLFEKYSGMLSANWLGVATIDTRLHEKDAVERLSDSFAREAWKILTYDGIEKRQKDSATILSDAGIAISDLKSLVTVPKTYEEPTTDKGNDMTLEQVIAKLHDYCGGIFDEDEYRPNLELSYDEDDGLALGAMQRLGGDMPCVEAMRMAYFEHGDDLPVLVMQRLVDFDPSSAAEAAGHEPSFEEARIAPPVAVKKKGRGKAADAEQPPVPGSVPRTVLSLLKDHSSAKDQDLADGIGTSRATFNNYVNGKAQLIASAEQRQFLIDTLRKHKEGLVEALRQLGEE